MNAFFKSCRALATLAAGWLLAACGNALLVTTSSSADPSPASTVASVARPRLVVFLVVDGLTATSSRPTASPASWTVAPGIRRPATRMPIPSRRPAMRPC